MQNLQQQARRNLRQQQDRPTPKQQKRRSKRPAETKRKYDFFGGYAYPEQAFTQDNAKSG
jgi:hypothetical protein